MNIPVILGSVREGRQSIYPARLMVERLKQAGCESVLADFKEMPLPFVDTAQEPSALNKKFPYPNVQKWSGIADRADGFVIVTPEYNHGFPGVLKNALDWLYPEFDRKPVGLVGVSNGPVGGARVIELLRPICENFSMFAIRETVMFAKVQDAFDPQGRLVDESYNKKIDGLVKSLLFSAAAMKQAKAAAGA
jgi:NAD(P)H-dependent FMN reductase